MLCKRLTFVVMVSSLSSFGMCCCFPTSSQKLLFLHLVNTEPWLFVTHQVRWWWCQFGHTHHHRGFKYSPTHQKSIQSQEALMHWLEHPSSSSAFIRLMLTNEDRVHFGPDRLSVAGRDVRRSTSSSLRPSHVKAQWLKG